MVVHALPNLGAPARIMKTIVITLVFFAVVGCSIQEPRVETRPTKYAALMAEWAPTGLVAHFPNPLPPAASIIKLWAFPGFMQGGASFQIRLSLPADEVSKVYDDAVKAAKDSYDGGDAVKSVNSKKGGLYGTSFHTSDDKQRDFPDDYRVFVFAAESFGDNTWNHGQSHGVVVSKQRNEVIYYAERW
jgi:hypothetical protein